MKRINTGKHYAAQTLRIRNRKSVSLLAAVLCAVMLMNCACLAAAPGEKTAGIAPGSVGDGGAAVTVGSAGGAPIEYKTLSTAGGGAGVAGEAAAGGAAGGAADGAAGGNANGAGEAATGAQPGAAAEPVPLNGLTILAINSSRAVIDGVRTDLVSDLPGLTSYLRDNKTYVPAEYIEKSFGLTSSHNESKGMFRLKNSRAATLLTLNSSEYDYSLDEAGNIVVYLPLRKVVEALGKSVAYYDGLIVISDEPSPFDPVRDNKQLAEIKTALTGAVSVDSAVKFENLLQSSNLTYYGAYDNYINQPRKSRYWMDYGYAIEEAEAPQMAMDDGAFAITGAGGAGTADSSRLSGAPSNTGADVNADIMLASPFSPNDKAAAANTAPTTVAAAVAPEAEAPAPSQAPAPMPESGTAAETSADMQIAVTDESSGEYSKTNTQVEGVDESDVVKTDGRYIYQVNGRRILIADAYPPSGMKLVGQVDFNEDDKAPFTPLEMYVDADTLVVIGSTYRVNDIPDPIISIKANSVPMRGGVMVDEVAVADEPMYPYYYWNSEATRVLVYDMKDRGNLKLIRESVIEGGYKTSRKIGGALYLITNKPLNYWGPYYDRYYGIMPIIEEAFPSVSAGDGVAGSGGEDGTSGSGGEDGTSGSGGKDGGDAAGGAGGEGSEGGNGSAPNLPAAAYFDSATTNGAYVDVDYSCMYYFPGCVSRNYLIVAGIDTRDVEKPISVESILDYGNNVYASSEYIYVATQNYSNTFWDKGEYASSAVTSVHRFRLDGSSVVYDGKGEVNGSVLNQFSMDQSGEYLRVATTSESYSYKNGYVSQNNLYILDGSLKVVGRLEGIAPGEHIYSVRFIGTRGYVVTFKTVDPLFVIDLADPAAPKILGSLKIPGYSDYLHPYDENHIIGFGKDTVEYADQYGGGGATAYYQGIKIALFDVSDVANPIEMFKTNIGDRGTDSELLRNHKALLFSKELELLAFPVTVMTVPDSQKTGNLKQDTLAYGQFEFQGAYVYNLNLKDGFTLTGKITHISPDDYKMYGSWYWGGDDKAIERLLYIKDTLFALSKAYITASRIADPGRETGRLTLK